MMIRAGFEGKACASDSDDIDSAATSAEPVSAVARKPVESPFAPVIPAPQAPAMRLFFVMS